MELKDQMAIVKSMCEIIALFIGAFIAFRIYWKFIPIIYLDISSEWLDKETGKLKLKLTIENKGGVKAKKDIALLQIFEYPLSSTEKLMECVPMFKEEFDELNLKVKPTWKPPTEFWKQSQAFYHGRSMSTEYLYSCPPDNLLHVCLFVSTRTDYGFGFRRKRKRKEAKILNEKNIRILDFSESWATTKIIANASNVIIPDK